MQLYWCCTPIAQKYLRRGGKRGVSVEKWNLKKIKKFQNENGKPSFLEKSSEELKKTRFPNETVRKRGLRNEAFFLNIKTVDIVGLCPKVLPKYLGLNLVLVSLDFSYKKYFALLSLPWHSSLVSLNLACCVNSYSFPSPSSFANSLGVGSLRKSWVFAPKYYQSTWG